MIVRYKFGWCIIIQKPGSRCSLAFSNVAVRIWNEIAGFVLPILICLYVSIRSLMYIRHTHSLQMTILRKHHRRLIYRFLFFYTIWLILWGPYVFVTYLNIETMMDEMEFIVVLVTTLDTAIDGILLCDLDKRFEIAWRKTFFWLRKKFRLKKTHLVYPIVESRMILDTKDALFIKNVQERLDEG
jgi:hypothetical protein